jgi:hypothetical protein
MMPLRRDLELPSFVRFLGVLARIHYDLNLLSGQRPPGIGINQPASHAVVNN